MAQNSPSTLVCERVGDIKAPPFEVLTKKCEECAKDIYVCAASLISMPTAKLVCAPCARQMIAKANGKIALAPPTELQKRAIMSAFPKTTDELIGLNNRRRLGLK